MCSKNLLSLLIFGVHILFASCQTWPRFNLYTKASPNSFVVVSPSSLANSAYDSRKESKFIVHGFGNSGESAGVISIKSEILKKEDVNVFIVDWKEGAASPNYLAAFSNVKVTGPKIAEFIQQAGINPQKVHCIGHSLGAHVCGFAGKTVKINRITGLDPAGPLFFNTPASGRLDKDDANYVDNIHTDVIFGIQQAIGHKDFYPNGGKAQAGCSKDVYEPEDYIKISFSNDPRADPVELLSCSHNRAPYLYTESVTTNCLFKSVPCDTYDNFQQNKCNCNSSFGCASMGHKSNRTAETGKFFLNTAGASPFCLS